MASPRGALMEVLRGQSTEGLKLRSNVVRVFVSSTFTGGCIFITAWVQYFHCNTGSASRYNTRQIQLRPNILARLHVNNVLF